MNIPVIIVGYRNCADVVGCLTALQRAAPEPEFDVYICENGGRAAYATLIEALGEAGGPCIEAATDSAVGPNPRFAQIRCLKLRHRNARVCVAEATENLGYAGGVNAWLAVLLDDRAWPGVWILNPDTEPAPTALAELVAWSQMRGKAMVGSRIVSAPGARRGLNRGLRWRPLLASTKGVDKGAPVDAEPDPDRLEACLDAPSGSSMYVTRACIDAIGLMDERYFLYFEDLDWGCRAKKAGGVGYAHRAVVVHRGGTTIGSTGGRAKSSPLSVYLEFRNRVHFVRHHHPRWMGWTLVILLLRSLEYGMVGALTNMSAALRGIYAGALGETGRPDAVFAWDGPRPMLRLAAARAATAGKSDIDRQARLKARLKIPISLVYYLIVRLGRWLRRRVGRPGPHRLIILYYHDVPARLRAHFARQLDILATHATVRAADYAAPAAPGGHSVAITFDDAYTSILDNAIPELRARRMPSTIFVPVGALGRRPVWMLPGHDAEAAEYPDPVATAQSLRGLDPQLVTLGAHSLTHPRLPFLPLERARSEIAGCRELIRAILGVDARLFAFPYGEYDATTVELCRQAGYQHVFTNSPGAVDPAADEFVRGRVRVEPDDGPLEFFLKMAGAYNWMRAASACKRMIRSRVSRRLADPEPGGAAGPHVGAPSASDGALAVSVIIPHYNDFAHLERCLASLEQQTLARDRFEVIVADNNSPGGVAAVARLAGNAIVVPAPEQGAGPARNAGAAVARGAHLAFIDSDCVADKEWLREGLNALERFDYVGGRVITTIKDRQRPTRAEAFEAVFAFNFKKYIEKHKFSGSGNLFVPKVVFERVGGFRARVSEDVEWCRRANALGFRLGYADRAIVCHPARRQWSELTRRWDRVLAEDLRLAMEEPGWRWHWILHAIIVALSPLGHWWQIVTSRRLTGWHARWQALLGLVAIRAYRSYRMLALLVTPVADAPVAAPAPVHRGATGGSVHRIERSVSG